MDTTEQKEKRSYRRLETQIEFREPAQWKIGERVLTVMGGLPNQEKRPIGYVGLNGYDGDNKPMLTAYDLDGNPICETSSSIYQLKKEFRLQEERLTKAMLIRENAEKQQATPEQKVEEKQKTPPVKKDKELKEVRQSKTTKEQDNDITQSR